MKLLKVLVLAFACLAMFGCVSRPQAVRVFDIPYQSEYYKVPAGEVWQLTWTSPYQRGEVHPAYDVRVLGQCYTSGERGTSLHAFAVGEDGLLDISAGYWSAAEIWVPAGSEFYLKNEFVRVRVEVHQSAFEYNY